MDVSNPTYAHLSSYESDDVAPHNALTDSELQKLYRVNLTLSQQTPVGNGLGTLEVLPLEILLQVLDLLSIPWLMRFRHVNHYAGFVINSIPNFRTIVEQAPQAIRGILAIQTSYNATLSYLYSKLHQRVCDSCGSLAQHLWLPTVSRLCSNCIDTKPRLLQHDEILHHYDLEPDGLIRIPSFRFIPAIFGNHRFCRFLEVRDGHILFDTDYAERIMCQRTQRSVRGPERFGGKTESAPVSIRKISGLVEGEELISLLSTPFPNPSVAIIEAGYPPWLPRWKMATVIAPWISGKGAEMGVLSVACSNTSERDHLYTRQDGLEHLRYCRTRLFGYLKRRTHTHDWSCYPRLELVSGVSLATLKDSGHE